MRGRAWRSVRGDGTEEGACRVSLPEGARPPESGVRAAGPEGQHIVSREGTRRGGVGEGGREGGRAAFGCRTRNPRSPPLHRRSPTAGGARGGGGRAGWGPRGAAATPGSSTRALRQAATRAHLPAAAAGCVIGCPRRAREIELSIHSGAGLSPRALGDARCRPPTRRRVLARDVGAHGRRRRRRRPLSSRRPLVWEPVLRSCRALRAPGGTRAGGPWDAPCGKRERRCEKVPGRFLLD